MKAIKIVLFFVLLGGVNLTAQSQVLISLLFGEYLNTGKIEFGLDGGLNYSTLSGTTSGESLRSFNLGFYFDIKMKHPSWMLHTGVIVKSTLGGEGIPVYPVGDSYIDSVFSGGSINRKLSCFNVPILIKYTTPIRLYGEAGVTLGLRYRVYDDFVASYKADDDLGYRLNVKKEYHPLDAGLMAGIGYRLMKGPGMNIGARYYLGLVDILIDDSGDHVSNRSFYLVVGIPIGAGSSGNKNNN